MFIWSCNKAVNLWDEGDEPDDVVDRVGKHTLEHVPLPVDLSRVDFVEQGHHDERVEDDGEVLRRRRTQVWNKERVCYETVLNRLVGQNIRKLKKINSSNYGLWLYY